MLNFRGVFTCFLHPRWFSRRISEPWATLNSHFDLKHLVGKDQRLGDQPPHPSLGIATIGINRPSWRISEDEFFCLFSRWLCYELFFTMGFITMNCSPPFWGEAFWSHVFPTHRFLSQIEKLWTFSSCDLTNETAVIWHYTPLTKPVEHWKNIPCCLGYVGDEILPMLLYGDYFINHDIRIPY